MISSPAREKTAVSILLGLLLLLVLIFGAGSYTAALGSDPFGIVHFAQHLSRGEFYSDYPVYGWVKTEWAPGESRFVLGGNYINTGGRMYNKYTIGFPLFLALSLRLFGPASVYYFNLVVLLALLFFLYRLALRLLGGQPGGRWLALAAPLILLIMVDPAWRLAQRPSHDLAGIMFIVAGAFLAIRALGDPPRIRIFSLLAAAFAFGCAGTLRLPNVLAAVPAGLYFLSRVAGRVRCWRILILSLLGVALFALALTPALVQNQLTGGHPLRPPRPEIVSSERTVFGGLDQASPPPLWIGFFPTTFPEVVRYFWRLWGPLFTFLLLLGLVSLWRLPETRWLLIGIPLILILLYSMWVHLMARYMLVAHPFLIVLMVAGVGRLLRARTRWWSSAALAAVVFLDFLMRSRAPSQYRLGHLDFVVLAAGLVLWIVFTRGRGGWRSPAGLVAALLLIFAARYGFPWLRRPEVFQLREASRFGADIDALVPPESVIISTKPIYQYIHLFSSSYSLRPFEMGRIGVDPRTGFDRLLARGTELYVLDNSSYKRDSGKSLPLFREYYDLTPAGELPAARYRLTAQFGKPVGTLFRVEPWSAKELTREFNPGAVGSDLLLAFNLRSIRDPERPRQLLEVELDGRRIPGPFFNGMNYLHLKREDLSSPRLTLTIRSDRPLPRDIDLRVEDLHSPYRVDLAGQIRFPDRDGADIFTEDRLRDGDLVRLGWGKTGRVAIPTVNFPQSRLVVEVKVQKARELGVPVGVRADLNGQPVAELSFRPGTDWEVWRFLLPERLISSGRGELDFTALRPPDRRLSLAEENSGALVFQSIAVRRWFARYPLPTERGDDYFLALQLSPPPLESCTGPYRILVEGRAAAVVPGEGVHRLILRSDDIARPVSRLEALASDDACRPLLCRPPFLFPAAGELLINIGEEEDWAFLEGGFYEPELHLGQTPVRWTRETARIALPIFPREGKEMVVTVKTIQHRPPAAFRESPRVAAGLDGRELSAYPLRSEDALYSWTLPSGDGEPRVGVLTLRTDPWRPSRYLPSVDHRKLGLMLEWVKLEYREAGE